MLDTVGRFIYKKYWGILRNTLCWTLWEDVFTQNIEEYFMLNTGKIYLPKILGTTLCWALLGDLFTQNTGDYRKLNTGNVNINYGLTPCA